MSLIKYPSLVAHRSVLDRPVIFIVAEKPRQRFKTLDNNILRGTGYSHVPYQSSNLTLILGTSTICEENGKVYSTGC